MANQHEHQRVAVNRNNKIELEAFHCDSTNKYNKHPHIHHRKNEEDMQVLQRKKNK